MRPGEQIVVHAPQIGIGKNKSTPQMGEHSHKLVIDGITANFNWHSKSTYPITGLGCHTGALCNLAVTTPYSGSTEGGFNLADKINILIASNLGTQIVEIMCKTVTGMIEGSHRRSHWIISANYSPRTSKTYASWTFWNTCDIMEILIDHCAKDPQKYGVCVATEYTENMAHSYKSDRSRTVVWIPPHVERRPPPEYRYNSKVAKAPSY